MAVPPASNAALTPEFLERHAGAFSTISSQRRRLRAELQTCRGVSKECALVARGSWLMAKSSAAPGARLGTAWKPRVVGTLVIVAGSFLAMLSVTHAAEPPGSPAPSDKQPSTDAGRSGNLSERLNESGGVIKPPENVDPGLQKKPPEDSAKMPVIPPPGSPGGDPNVKPK
jgi:hypothetical protein